MDENKYWFEEAGSYSAVFGDYTMRLEIHEHDMADGYYIVIDNSLSDSRSFIEEIPTYEEAIEKARQIKTKILESDEALSWSIN